MQTHTGSVNPALVSVSSYELWSCEFTEPSFLGVLCPLWLLCSFCLVFYAVAYVLREGFDKDISFMVEFSKVSHSCIIGLESITNVTRYNPICGPWRVILSTCFFSLYL